jgi:hypothetical protein
MTNGGLVVTKNVGCFFLRDQLSKLSVLASRYGSVWSSHGDELDGARGALHSLKHEDQLGQRRVARTHLQEKMGASAPIFRAERSRD